MEEEHTFSNQALFPYNKVKKLRFAATTIALLFLFAVLFAGYLLLFRESDIWLLVQIKNFVNHINQNISTNTILGVLYASTFGGLFFVTIPLEILFMKFLKGGANPYFLIITFILGFVISFTINYLIGQKLNTFTKKLLSPKKFYKIKGLLNKHGVLAVFIINLIPFLPAQPLSAILGAFNYNKTKFYVYFILGQLIKFTALAVGYIYIFGNA